MKKFYFILLLIFSINANAQDFNDSFNKSKRLLENQVYTTPELRHTIYCNVPFLITKKTILPDDFPQTKRALQIEWEHVVPAENLGRNFVEWREGHPDCIDKNSKIFKGRNCALKTNSKYRYMYADMYNLYPAVGYINNLRSNFNFTMLPQEKAMFDSCLIKINNKKVEPPENARGKIARTYLYMDATYPRYNMSEAQRKLMNVWNKQYPVTKDECTRTKLIEQIQGNENKFVKDMCIDMSLWG